MNTWIDHVKQVQNKNNISYKEALQLAKQTYQGGSLKSNYIRYLYHKNQFNPELVRNNPSTNIIKKQQQKKWEREFDERVRKEKEEKEQYFNRQKPIINNEGIDIPFNKFSKDKLINSFYTVISEGLPNSMQVRYQGLNNSAKKQAIIDFLQKQLKNNKLDENKFLIALNN